jgi:hypothetical protein
VPGRSLRTVSGETLPSARAVSGGSQQEPERARQEPHAEIVRGQRPDLADIAMQAIVRGGRVPETHKEEVSVLPIDGIRDHAAVEIGYDDVRDGIVRLEHGRLVVRLLAQPGPAMTHGLRKHTEFGFHCRRPCAGPG